MNLRRSSSKKVSGTSPFAPKFPVPTGKGRRSTNAAAIFQRPSPSFWKIVEPTVCEEFRAMRLPKRSAWDEADRVAQAFATLWLLPQTRRRRPLALDQSADRANGSDSSSCGSRGLARQKDLPWSLDSGTGTLLEPAGITCGRKVCGTVTVCRPGPPIIAGDGEVGLRRRCRQWYAGPLA